MYASEQAFLGPYFGYKNHILLKCKLKYFLLCCHRFFCPFRQEEEFDRKIRERLIQILAYLLNNGSFFFIVSPGKFYLVQNSHCTKSFAPQKVSLTPPSPFLRLN